MLSVFHALSSSEAQLDAYWHAQLHPDTVGSIAAPYQAHAEFGMATKCMAAELGKPRIPPASPPREQGDKATVAACSIEDSLGASDAKQQQKHDQSAPSKTNAESGKDLVESKRIRRQEQNRSSQRAFRLRKESHIRSLREKLAELHKTHRSLCQSYMRKCEEVDQLNTYVSELNVELLRLQTQLPQSCGAEMFSPVPATALSSGSSFDTATAAAAYTDFMPVDIAWRPKWESDLMTTTETWYSYQ